VSFALRLTEDRLSAGARLSLPRTQRILYVRNGAARESGREPVLAKASPETATAFVRVSILPQEIRGQSSIVYVDPADAGRGRPRQYTVYVDEPVVLP